MSDKERMYMMCILFPIFWPFLPFLIVADICALIWEFLTWLGRAIAKPFRAAIIEAQMNPICRANGHAWGDPNVQTWEETEDHPGGPPCNDMFLVTYEQRTRFCGTCGEKDVSTTRDQAFNASA
jgi:hypothetical protein